ncbi:MAG: MFS transporter, partial [Candidatus Eremiobacterota bacterium]
FFIPSVLALLIAIAGYFSIVNHPEDLGFPPVEQPDKRDEIDSSPHDIKELFRKVLGNKIIWIIACAYFCTGIVRHGFEQWFPKYLQEVHHMKTDGTLFQITVMAIPACAVIGAAIAGYTSDRFFGGRRGPVASIMYFCQVLLIVLFNYVSSPVMTCFILIVLSIMISGPHALLGAAAAMDFGGRRASGFAGGLIDSFQYIGAGLTGFGIGIILDRAGWTGWLTGLTGFALVGGILMAVIWHSLPEKVSSES